MEKVKLPREVAEAIDIYRNDTVINNWKGAILKVALEPERYIRAGTDDVIKAYVTPHTIDTFLQALVNGYKVEETPEEKAADYITRLRNMRDHTYTDPAKQRELNIEVSGAIQVLEYLNIKITGVNE